MKILDMKLFLRLSHAWFYIHVYIVKKQSMLFVHEFRWIIWFMNVLKNFCDIL